jgi:hypothetical protein
MGLAGENGGSSCEIVCVRSGSSVPPIAQRMRGFGLGLGVWAGIPRKRVLPVLYKSAQLRVSLNVSAVAAFIFADTIGRVAFWTKAHKDFDALRALVRVAVDCFRRHYLTSGEGGSGRKWVG